MRAIAIILASACLFSVPLTQAATITPEEQKLQSEFGKAYNNPDKEARKTALAMLAGAKHSSSWQLLYQRAVSDPEAEVKLEAFTILAKEPARDGSLASMLARGYSAVNINDKEGRLNYAKAMVPSEFKAEIVFAVADHLTKLRYPDVPKLIQSQGGGGASDNRRQIEAVKKQRKEFEDLLEAFNAIAKSEVASATKDAPVLLKKWLEMNQATLVKADRDLADKYKKEDAEAAKAAKEAKK